MVEWVLRRGNSWLLFSIENRLFTGSWDHWRGVAELAWPFPTADGGEWPGGWWSIEGCKEGRESLREGKNSVRESVLCFMRFRVLKPEYISFGEIFGK